MSTYFSAPRTRRSRQAARSFGAVAAVTLIVSYLPGNFSRVDSLAPQFRTVTLVIMAVTAATAVATGVNIFRRPAWRGFDRARLTIWWWPLLIVAVLGLLVYLVLAIRSSTQISHWDNSYCPPGHVPRGHRAACIAGSGHFSDGFRNTTRVVLWGLIASVPMVEAEDRDTDSQL